MDRLQTANPAPPVSFVQVLNLGFVLMNVPEQCPRIVALLAESYNPHARCASGQGVMVFRIQLETIKKGCAKG
jgi:hypothetical protein